ncbi:hypothetical protein TEQG_08756 [Trichophyton equinum CBS 127.97]|uniref:Uncharacterized protein n=1 Tax=Trichophyton equinum (strain ATCC MYA-4606 / CBS 127.97) TaxID=559882 RepID=F2PZR2_TRIEC|nr:hypothetical protein TEQG_08756 [Trichophyton equinum CBS 127.97]
MVFANCTKKRRAPEIGERESAALKGKRRELPNLFCAFSGIGMTKSWTFKGRQSMRKRLYKVKHAKRRINPDAEGMKDDDGKTGAGESGHK